MDVDFVPEGDEIPMDIYGVSREPSIGTISMMPSLSQIPAQQLDIENFQPSIACK